MGYVKQLVWMEGDCWSGEALLYLELCSAAMQVGPTNPNPGDCALHTLIATSYLSSAAILVSKRIYDRAIDIKLLCL